MYVPTPYFLTSFLFRSLQNTKQSCRCIWSVPISDLFMRSSVYVNSNLPVHHIPPTLLVSICLFSTSVSLFLLCKSVHLYHFSRFHTYALVYYMQFSLTHFILCDRLQVYPVVYKCYTLVPFFGLSNMPLYIYVPHLLYPFLC